MLSVWTSCRQLSVSFKSIYLPSAPVLGDGKWLLSSVKKGEGVGNSGEQLECCSTHAADCMVGAFSGESWPADSWHFFSGRCEIWPGWGWWAALPSTNGWKALIKAQKTAQQKTEWHFFVSVHDNYFSDQHRSMEFLLHWENGENKTSASTWLTQEWQSYKLMRGCKFPIRFWLLQTPTDGLQLKRTVWSPLAQIPFSR